jgi:hypothetical protein
MQAKTLTTSAYTESTDLIFSLVYGVTWREARLVKASLLITESLLLCRYSSLVHTQPHTLTQTGYDGKKPSIRKPEVTQKSLWIFGES